METVQIANAYEIKEMLKSKGAKFDAESKNWIVKKSDWNALVELSKSPACGMNFKRGMSKARAI